MSASTVASNTVDERAVLRQLAWIQAKRYLRHPLYWIGVALLVASALWSADDAGWDPSTFAAVGWTSAFAMGVLGLIVAYRLTRTEDRALALLPSAPADAGTRTLALLGACLVPAATALIFVIVRLVEYLIWAPFPGLVEAMGGWGVVVASLLDTAMVASFGGPALGVAAGRWLRFPGAGVMIAIVLVIVVAATSGSANQNNSAAEARQDNVVLQSLATAMPWTAYVTSGCPTEDAKGNCQWTLDGVRDGSQVGHMLYAFFLSGLACWAAMIRVAEGAVRRRWVSIGWICAIGASLSLTWALFG